VRKNLLFIFTLFSWLSYSQDAGFLNSLNTPLAQNDAKTVAELLVSKLKNEYSFYKLKEFDNGLLRIVYAPKGMDEAAIKAQADYEDCCVVDFKATKVGETKTYRFDKAKAKYDDLFAVWKKYFRADAQPDKKTQRYANAEKTMLFSLINLGDVWAIGR
jgi:hypothetical protein